MISYFVRPFRRAIQLLVSYQLPHELAAGITIGMIVGLMPKGNLIALSLCVLLFSLRVNAGLGLAAAVAFSWLGPLGDAFADKLGGLVLTAGPLQPTYAAAFQLPLGPWLDFDNTVVAGSLLIGLYVAYPVYWLSLVSIRWWQGAHVEGGGQGLGKTPLRVDGTTPDDRARRVA
jgi:uncharacterized protein (TIGR03546 family)